MTKMGWFSRLSNQPPAIAPMQRIVASLGAVILLGPACIATAQNPKPVVPTPEPESQVSAPVGYSIHQTVDLGGRISNQVGSPAMYDTLVNMQSGPRVLGESLQMHLLPGHKGTLVDSLSAIGSGFGGDPNQFGKLDFQKGKLYEFSGLFRRDRQYFDYDLLGNPNIVGGAPVLGAPTSVFAWQQVNQSPFLFNTVRRMTDTNLTIFPLSKFTFRAGYSQNTFEGPSLSPGASSPYFALSIGANDVLLQQYQRNSTDDFTGAIDWKPVNGTKLTFEEEIDHYKGDSFFTVAPSEYVVQEADGTKAALAATTAPLPIAPSIATATASAPLPCCKPRRPPAACPLSTLPATWLSTTCAPSPRASCFRPRSSACKARASRA
jgi:hypothetical protein